MTSFADDQEPKSELIFEEENNQQNHKSIMDEFVDSNTCI